MIKQFEVWHSYGTTSLVPRGEKEKYGVASDAELLYIVEGRSWNEVMSIHYERQGFDPYVPFGEDVVFED